MKKTFLAAAAALAALFFVSCSDGVSYDSHIDTVLYLEIPEVKATAYPGMNIVSWKPVAGANGYVLYTYENEVCIEKNKFAYDDTLSHRDTSNIKNGVERTYYVEAESKSSTSRSVNTENAMSSGVTVKGILPPADTKSLELYAYENYGTKEAPKGNADYVVSASNIHIARDAENKIGITMPVKAYLSYDIYYTCGNKLETLGEKTQVGSGSVTSDINDATIGLNKTITAPGVYKAVVVAEAANSLFGTSEQIVSEESVTVESLNVSGAAMTSAYYKDSADGKTVSIYFDGAKFTADSTPVPTEYYKVYRSVRGKYDYTAVSGAVTEIKANANAFRVEDVVPDNTVDYTYTLVVTDGTQFASVNNNARTVYAFVDEQDDTSVSGTVANPDNINLTADINWTITLPRASSDDVEITGVYILEKPLTDSTAPCATDFAGKKDIKDQLKPLVNNGYTVTTEKRKDVNVYMLVTTSQENRKDDEWISTAVEVEVPVAAPSITATAKGTDKKVDIEVTDSNSSSDYSYTLYRPDSDSPNAVWVELNANLGAGTKDYSKTYTDTVPTVDAISGTTYVYIVVKTWGDKKATAITTATVTN